MQRPMRYGLVSIRLVYFGFDPDNLAFGKRIESGKLSAWKRETDGFDIWQFSMWRCHLEPICQANVLWATRNHLKRTKWSSTAVSVFSFGDDADERGSGLDYPCLLQKHDTGSTDSQEEVLNLESKRAKSFRETPWPNYEKTQIQRRSARSSMETRRKEKSLCRKAKGRLGRGKGKREEKAQRGPRQQKTIMTATIVSNYEDKIYLWS